MNIRSYKFLEQVFAKIQDVDDVISFLNCGAADNHLDQTGPVLTLEEIKHEMLGHEAVGEAIADALGSKKEVNEWELANVYCMDTLHRHRAAVPIGMFKESLILRGESRRQWLIAKQGGYKDVKGCLAAFEKVVVIQQEIASLKSTALKIPKYDTFLNEQEYGLGTAEIDVVFANIGAFYPKFLKSVLGHQHKNKIIPIKDITGEKLKVLNDAYVSSLGLSFQQIQDCTSRCKFAEYCDTYAERRDHFGLRHNMVMLLKLSGHSIYHSFLPKVWSKQPVGQVGGRSIFDAQALLMSNYIGASTQFMDFIQPYVKKGVSLRGKASAHNNLHAIFNRVEPNLMLDKSDQVTTIAHVMLRYALEKEIIEGELEVKDLHDAWSEGVKHYFGLEVQGFAESFMQDDLWISGDFGVAPFQIISDIMAAQIFHVLCEEEANILDNVAKGDFNPLVHWLKNNVYSQGNRYTSSQLLKNITGQTLDVEFYKQQLSSRYLG